MKKSAMARKDRHVSKTRVTKTAKPSGRRTRGARPAAAGAARARPADLERTVQAVRERYARIASGEMSGCCGAGAAPGADPVEIEVSRRIGYSEQDLTVVPEGANLGVGCGAPVGLLDLRPGETVLDLGSGAGLDAFLAARSVGPGGRVIGIDMTREMLERARRNATDGGYTQVEFREGRLEALPVEDASVDAVTSNCVINLVPDKAAVFREVARVLRPGGRIVASDIVLDGRLPEAIEKNLMAYVGCISGALERSAYFSLVEAAGLTDVRIFKDVEFLETAGYPLSDDLLAAIGAAGITRDDLKAKVRSVTFRAIRPAGGSNGR